MFSGNVFIYHKYSLIRLIRHVHIWFVRPTMNEKTIKQSSKK